MDLVVQTKMGARGTMTYHDLFITTKDIDRTSIFDLPYNYRVECQRTTGWILTHTNLDTMNTIVIASEYDDENWLVLDVKGYVIVDSRKQGENDE